MANFARTVYIDICSTYRITLVTLCTLIYLLSVANSGNWTPRKLLIALGMLASCFLAVYLYRKISAQVEQRRWIRGILGLELFAYGIFTFLSGGFSSPYFWYYIGCLFAMAAVECRTIAIGLGMLWCLLCAAASRSIAPQETIGTELNLAIGSLISIATFYLLLRYVQRLLQQQELQEKLNFCLQQEKERSEQALKHTTDLYDTFNLLAMTDPHKIIEELGHTLWRAIAPGGCVLAKLGADGAVEKQVAYGIKEARASRLVDAALAQRNTSGQDEPAWRELDSPDGQVRFESRRIGKLSPPQGVLIRQKTEQKTAGAKQDSIYCRLVEIIFHNLDTQRQLEDYITAEEQQRLASEIHDTVIQKLFGLACGLKLLQTDIVSGEGDKAAEKSQALKDSAELIMKELREAIYGRDFNGGADAFRHKLNVYMEEMKKLSGADIRLQLDDKVEVMTAAQKVAIYRIACEAVNNAIRHGQAQCVTIGIQMEQDAIRAEITDNGAGCVNYRSDAPLHGKGVKNMRRMVSLLKGQFALEPGKEKGTTVRFSLPR